MKTNGRSKSFKRTYKNAEDRESSGLGQRIHSRLSSLVLSIVLRSNSYDPSADISAIDGIVAHAALVSAADVASNTHQGVAGAIRRVEEGDGPFLGLVVERPFKGGVGISDVSEVQLVTSVSRPIDRGEGRSGTFVHASDRAAPVRSTNRHGQLRASINKIIKS